MLSDTAAPEDFEGDLAPEVRDTVVARLRELARDWQSSDLMDAAAYFEGTL